MAINKERCYLCLWFEQFLGYVVTMTYQFPYNSILSAKGITKRQDHFRSLWKTLSVAYVEPWLRSMILYAGVHIRIWVQKMLHMNSKASSMLILIQV